MPSKWCHMVQGRSSLKYTAMQFWGQNTSRRLIVSSKLYISVSKSKSRESIELYILLVVNTVGKVTRLFCFSVEHMSTTVPSFVLFYILHKLFGAVLVIHHVLVMLLSRQCSPLVYVRFDTVYILLLLVLILAELRSLCLFVHLCSVQQVGRS